MPAQITNQRSLAAVAVITCGLGLFGCDNEVEPKPISNDIGALRKIVHLNMRATSARWEAYGYPEARRYELLPTNIDATILVAELTPSDPQAFSIEAPQDKPVYAYGAARPWLDARFRTLLGQETIASVDLSTHGMCRPLKAILSKTNAPIDGFICNSGNKALVYLVLGTYM